MTLQEIQYKAQSIISEWRDEDSAPYIEFVEELAHMIVPEPSEELEKAASEYSTNEADRVWGKPDPHDYTDHSGCGAAHDNYEVGLRVGFIAGAEWQKEQMMKEAVEGEITKDNRGNNVLRVGLFNNGFEIGDKVRVIVLPQGKLIWRAGDMKKKQPVPRYYTVREIKTGRIFQAEYDSESAAYYERGTGKEYNITEIEQI